jgi:hypothetical protein
MKDLEVRIQKDAARIEGSAIDLGPWDVAMGLRSTVWIHNPNKHAKAILKGLKHKDARATFDFPDEIMPSDTVPCDIHIPPRSFKTEAEEVAFFNEVLDTLSGTIRWEKP